MSSFLSTYSALNTGRTADLGFKIQTNRDAMRGLADTVSQLAMNPEQPGFGNALLALHAAEKELLILNCLADVQLEASYAWQESLDALRVKERERRERWVANGWMI